MGEGGGGRGGDVGGGELASGGDFQLVFTGAS